MERQGLVGTPAYTTIGAPDWDDPSFGDVLDFGGYTFGEYAFGDATRTGTTTRSATTRSRP